MEKLGTVWPVEARLYDEGGKLLDRCLCTPKHIREALKKNKKAVLIVSFVNGESFNREKRNDYLGYGSGDENS